MRSVKIFDAKNGLSRHIKYVQRGGRVRILDRDTPVADLVPVQVAPQPDDDDAWLAMLAARGLLRRGKGGPPPRDLLRPGPRGRGAVAALLDERRRSR